MQRKDALFVMALCFIVFLPCGAAWAAAGNVQSLKPEAWATHEAQRISIAVGDAIEQTYSLHTGTSGSLGVRFADGSEINLGGDTSIEVSDFVFDSSPSPASSPSLSLNLIKGAARVVTGAVVEQNPGGFKLSTPLGAVGVRGTTLDVQLMENTLRVAVIDMASGHDVIVTGLDGNSVRIVQPGTQVTLLRGQPTPSAPSPVPGGATSSEDASQDSQSNAGGQSAQSDAGGQSVQSDSNVVNLVMSAQSSMPRTTYPAFAFEIDPTPGQNNIHEHVPVMSGDGGTVLYSTSDGVTNSFKVWRAAGNADGTLAAGSMAIPGVSPVGQAGRMLMSRYGNVFALPATDGNYILDGAANIIHAPNLDPVPEPSDLDAGGQMFFGGINSNGGIIAGYYNSAQFNNDSAIVLWKRGEDGKYTAPPIEVFGADVPTPVPGNAYAVSDDGKIIAGANGNAAYWEQQPDGTYKVEFLFDSNDHPGGRVNAMTYDGRMMVGFVEQSGANNNYVPFWHDRFSTGAAPLIREPAEGFPGAEIQVISANGQVAGGTSSDANMNVHEATFWLKDEAKGISVFKHLAADNHVVLDSIELAYVSGISDDGTILLCTNNDRNSGEIYIVRIFGESLGLTTFNNVYASLGGVSAGTSQAALATLPLNSIPSISRPVNFGSIPSAGEGSEQRWRVWGSGSLLSDYELTEKDYGFEAGAGATYYFAEGWAAGAGAFGSYRRIEAGDYDSTQRITSGTLAAYAGYAPARTGLRFSGGLMAQSFDLDSKRRYANGASVATSSGGDTGWNFGTSLHFGWVFDVIDSLTVQPFAEYNFSYSLIPGFKESGGPFPVEYDDENFAQNTVRIGADFEYAITQNVSAQAWAAWNHRFEDKGPELSGRFLGWNNFEMPGAKLKQDWADAGVGVSWRFKPSMSLNTSAGFGFDNEGSGLPDMTLRCVLNIDL